MNITDNQAKYVEKIQKTLENRGIRIISDLRNEKIGFKIRENTLQRIPYLLVVGDKEMENNSLSVRTRKGEDFGSMSVDEFTDMLFTDISAKGRTFQ